MYEQILHAMTTDFFCWESQPVFSPKEALQFYVQY